ncbi:MAG: tetratricopeptide repeat protein [Planctomycetes bacterium]|nr:tetratricopeptide repeat protein [Thermoplasmata archaeon]MBE3143491.1 tetratricopeptide repeat protein [Planctomycetota bacterium]
MFARQLNRNIFSVGMILFCFAMFGCAMGPYVTPVAPLAPTITINTVPNGADISIQGNYVGVSPLAIIAPANYTGTEPMKIEARLEGYELKEVSFGDYHPPVAEVLTRPSNIFLADPIPVGTKTIPAYYTFLNSITIKLYSKGGSSVPVKTAEEYLQSGNTFFDQGNFSQTISDFTKAIEIDPKLAKAYNNRGFVYVTQGNFPQAILDFTKVIEINPQNADAYHSRGFVYAKQNNFIQAISDFTKAIEIDPKLAKAYNSRGKNYYNIKEYDKAWADVHKAEELGSAVSPELLAELKKASGRDK